VARSSLGTQKDARLESRAPSDDVAVEISHVGTEAAEDYALKASVVRFHFAHGDLRRRLLGIAVDAGRDRRKGDA
jgi:hypothetical protein